MSTVSFQSLGGSEKFLVYCYDAHCDGDGTQSEREKLQEELLQEWDSETDVCVDHPNNLYSCADNMRCLRDSGEDSWCSSDDARVMCRDCAGPGQKCEESDICHDELFFCDVLSEEAIEPFLKKFLLVAVSSSELRAS